MRINQPKKNKFRLQQVKNQEDYNFIFDLTENKMILNELNFYKKGKKRYFKISSFKK